MGRGLAAPSGDARESARSRCSPRRRTDGSARREGAGVRPSVNEGKRWGAGNDVTAFGDLAGRAPSHVSRAQLPKIRRLPRLFVHVSSDDPLTLSRHRNRRLLQAGRRTPMGPSDDQVVGAPALRPARGHAKGSVSHSFSMASQSCRKFLIAQAPQAL